MPAPLIPLAVAGITALGGAFNAASAAGQQKKDREQRMREFEQTMAQRRAELAAQQAQLSQNSAMDRAKYQDERGLMATKQQDRLNYAPMADRAAALMAARVGAQTAPWAPRDYTTGSRPGSGAATGGVASAMNAVNAANTAYKPGAGGLNTDEIAAYLNRLKDEQTLPAAYQGYGQPAPSYGGGGGGGGGGGRTPEEDALMSRFTPYLNY